MQRRKSRPLIARTSACHAPVILLFVFLPAPGLAARMLAAPKEDSQLSIVTNEQRSTISTVARKFERSEASDHLQTGFPLTGNETRVRCEVYGVSAKIDHSTMMPDTCGRCHNSAVATGKPINHITTSASCDACHTTRAWLPATFDHSVVTSGGCTACHNGITATGKPGDHVATAAACDNCHRTSAWMPVTFDHSRVAAGTCSGCHNGTSAPGKPTDHIPTTAPCDVCHRARAWLPATFDHGDVTASACINCHNNATATGKPDDHFVTSRTCDDCHITTGWLLVAGYRHSSSLFPGGHVNDVRCKGCHTDNTEIFTWEASVYKPDCAGCHANDYRPNNHIKSKNLASIFYTLNELRDCAGSCHEYTDNTFAIVLKTRTRNHRPSGTHW